MNWAHPGWLLLLLLFPFAAALAWAGERRYLSRLARWKARSAVSAIARATLVRISLRLLAWLSIIVALAGPRFDFTWQEIKRQGADVVIALDVSRSMDATDVSPSRLLRAKREIKDLMALSRGDRLGLVLYSGVSFVQCPLTHDLGAFQLYLDLANSDSLPSQGTSLAKALRSAGQALQEGSEVSSKGQAIILISDGEDHEGQAVEVARELAGRGITIHTIAVGGQGAPIPLPDGGFYKDEQGHLVISQPNETTLKEIAAAAGGQFVRAANGDFELERIYKTAIRPDLRVGEHTTREKVWIERHAWLSGLAALFLTIESLSALGWRRKAASERRGRGEVPSAQTEAKI